MRTTPSALELVSVRLGGTQASCTGLVLLARTAMSQAENSQEANGRLALPVGRFAGAGGVAWLQ